MPSKAKHAFGSLAGVQKALTDGLLDAYDILFLDGDTEPKIGWIDKKGEFKLVKGSEDVIVVEGGSLPPTGELGKVYIFGDNVYFWNGTAFKLVSNTADLTTLQNQVSELTTQMSTKVDEQRVQQMINSSSTIVEF